MKTAKEMFEELLELIKNNPDLPIYAWVSGDDSMEQGLIYPAQLKNPKIRRYCQVEPYGYYGSCWVFEDDSENYFEYLINQNEYEELTYEEAEKKVNEIIKNLDWQTAIFVDAPVI